MKIKITAILLIVLWAIVSCNKDNKILSKKPIPVPPFEVKIKLDPRAEKELKKRKETLHVSGYFSGTPRKDSGLKDNNKAVGFVIDSFEKELDIVDNGTVGRFDSLTIPEYILYALERKDYNVYISVRSGWKSTKFNLLTCDYFDKVISQVQNQQHVITCKLIRDPNVKWTGISYLVSLDEMAKYTKAQAFDKFIHQIEPFVIETFGDYSKHAVLLIKFTCTPNSQTVNIESQTIPKKLLRNLHHRLSELPKLETTGNVSFQTTYEITP